MNRQLKYVIVAPIFALSLVAFQTSAQSVAATTPPDGKAIYTAKCASCHRPDGKGQAVFPALAGSAVVKASDPSGVINRIEKGGAPMPSFKSQLSADEIAAVATYVRSSWGNTAGPVTADVVSAVK